MDIKLPSLGEGADSGTIVNILVKKGDRIKKDQPILELETEKAVGTIPSSAAGTVSEIRVKVGDKISAGQSILTLTEEAAGAEVSPEKRAAPKVEVKPEVRREVAVTEQYQSKSGFPPPASPSVRKMARDLGIDLMRVKGSEYGGRITLEDVRAYVEALQQKPGVAAVPQAERIDFSQWGPVTKKPLSSLRRTISRRMSESWASVPRVTQFDEADITRLNEWRKKHPGLTLTPLAMKAVVTTLKKHPVFNTSLDEAAGEIVFKEYYHLGVAVDTEHGLIVPVIRDVDKKSLLELSKELDELAEKTRQRKVTADQMKGGTFTISNQGGIGGGAFTPIVNKPEVAILGMGRGALKPAVMDGKIEPRLMLPLALSYDHRVIDGGSAARFIVDLVQAFEKFAESDVKV